MPIAALACQCGGADSWIRSKLNKFGYKHALLIPITKGKEKCLRQIATFVQTQETTELIAHIKNASKFAIIVGTDGKSLRWVDIVNGHWVKNDVDAEFIIRDFAK